MIGAVVERGFDNHLLHPKIAESHVIGSIPYDGVNVTQTFTDSSPNITGIDSTGVSTTQIRASIHDVQFNPLKIGYAMSVTFVIGAFQVTFDSHPIICLYHKMSCITKKQVPAITRTPLKFNNLYLI